jgi:DNA-binding transcriptional LysR family regulator
MPTRDSVENIIKNAIDIALVTLPVKEPRLRITPLRPEMLVAIIPADAKEIPEVVTPAFAARQSLVLEHARGAVHALITQWLSGEMPLPSRPMLVGTVEAMKTVVSLGLGMSIVPDVAAAEPTPNFVIRPLKPAVPCTLGLIELRNKPNDRALDIVRTALLGLRMDL